MKRMLLKLLARVALGVTLSTSAHAITFVGGPAGTAGLADGIGIGSDNIAYSFITPRHIIYGHASSPASVAGVNVVSTYQLSSSASAAGDYEVFVAELDSDVAGVTPLSIAHGTSGHDFLNLTLNVFGQNHSGNYGIQQTGSALDFILTNDKGIGGPPPPPAYLIPLYEDDGNDAFLYVDLRWQNSTNHTAFLQFGDSNSAVLVDLGGQKAILGTALGILDIENPLREVSENWTDVDVNVFGVLGYYRTQLDDYLSARSAALGSTYQASYLALSGAEVVPEPSVALLFSFGGLLSACLMRSRPAL